MKATWQTDSLSLYKGDCLQILPTFEAESFTACITDPPAGISFMGKAWDSDKGGRKQWIEWLTGVMREVYRVLKPGAHAIVWALPRTSHWTATALEDAGFEIRDVVMHLFGSGFPKSLDVSKAIDKAAGAERELVGQNPYNKLRGRSNGEYGEAWDKLQGPSTITAPATPAAKLWQGYGTALKPAAEHWILCRKPLGKSLTVAENCLTYGCGALNIDGTRIPMAPSDAERIESMGGFGKDGYTRPKTAETFMEGTPEATAAIAHSLGRWPAHIIHDGSDEVLEGFPDRDGASSNSSTKSGHAGTGWGMGNLAVQPGYADSGSAARFFYTAKPSRAERGEWITEIPRVRLRDDLTPEQIAFVRSELEKAGVQQ